MRTSVYLAAAIVISSGGSFSIYGQDENAKGSLKERLDSLFALTQVGDDRSLVSTGALLVLRKNGLVTYSPASPVPYLNTYKKGRISQPFMANVGNGILSPGSNATYPHHTFGAGAKLWVIGLFVHKDGVTFRLLDSGSHYYGDLKFPFEKGSVATPDQTLAEIAEVLTVQQAKTPPPPPPAVTPVTLNFPATFVSSQAPADHLQLNADHSFSLQEAGQPHSGIFVVNGSTLEINIDGNATAMAIEGNNLKDPSGQTWARKDQPTPPPPSAGVLQNQDIIKMVTATIDDAIIVAKIGSSKCQFDTSSDALIQLKTSGVSGPVLSAMLSAGK